MGQDGDCAGSIAHLRSLESKQQQHSDSVRKIPTTYQRAGINRLIPHMITRSSFLHPRRNNRYGQIKLRSDPNEGKDIFMCEFGPGMHFFQEFLSKNQSRSKHANFTHLDSFHIPWNTTGTRSLYGHLGSRPSEVRQSTIEHRFTLMALLFPQRPAPLMNTSSLGCKMPE